MVDSFGFCFFVSRGWEGWVGDSGFVFLDLGRGGVRSIDGEFSFCKEGRMGIFFLDKLEGRNKWL